MRITLWAAVLVFISPTALLAGEVTNPPAVQDPPDVRYELKPQGDGFVRLDRQSGALSYCVVTSAGLTCRLGADEREAWQQQLSELEGRMKLLEGQVAALPGDDPAATGVTRTKRQDRVAPPPAGEPPIPGPPQTGPEGPAEETGREMDRAMQVAEKAMRRFFEVVRQLRRDLQDSPKSQ